MPELFLNIFDPSVTTLNAIPLIIWSYLYVKRYYNLVPSGLSAIKRYSSDICLIVSNAGSNGEKLISSSMDAVPLLLSSGAFVFEMCLLHQNEVYNGMALLELPPMCFYFCLAPRITLRLLEFLKSSITRVLRTFFRYPHTDSSFRCVYLSNLTICD